MGISKERDRTVCTIYNFHRPLTAQRITSNRVLSRGSSKTALCDVIKKTLKRHSEKGKKLLRVGPVSYVCKMGPLPVSPSSLTTGVFVGTPTYPGKKEEKG